LDANAENCRRAEEAGFTVVFGDALQERTMQRARFELVGDVVGATPNQVLNSVFVRHARERFGIPRAYMSAPRPSKGLAPEMVATEKAVMLFEGPHDALRWDVRTRRKAVAIEKWAYEGPVDGDAEPTGEGATAANPSELFAVLTLKRSGKTQIMNAGLEPKVGDIASIAVHTVEGDAAHTLLGKLGWVPQPEESDPADTEAESAVAG
jgi:hypothetical protein